MDMFRKGKEKLGKRRSEEDQDKDGDDEKPEFALTTSTSSFGIGPWPLDYHQKRTSEPSIRYRPPLGSDSTNQIQRNVSVAGSEFPGLSSQIGRPGPVNTSSVSDPLGLTLVYAFPDPILDLIFVHGLGGTSKGTWSWERDPVNFWPPWLGGDIELSKTRIFTFGYNASFSGQYTTFNILDFAKDLLFRIKTYSGEPQQDDEPSAAIGELPIIFVAHSMGGLVVKKAYIIGKSDQQYADIIAHVTAIVFLATPHKGSTYAQTLNSILKATPGCSGKAYVAELEKNSSSLQDINEQFRNICGDLELVSFHETLKTSIGSVKRVIVDKDSALLEYPGETSSSLDADHHGMAKFKTPLDSNYTNVKNVLRWLLRKVVERAPTLGRHLQIKGEPVITRRPSSELSVRKRLMDLLGIVENVEDDLDYLADRTLQGSCQWLLRRQVFQDWFADSPNSSGLLWLTGSPGSGKSTLASFVIASLKNKSFVGTCHYHFFLAEHQTKRTLAYLLRSIALQAALSHEPFCSRLLELHDNTGINFSQQKGAIIWEKIFEGILFRLPFPSPLFWVFDGLDEAESPAELIKCLSKIKSATRINLLLVSRATRDLTKDINYHLPTMVHEVISADDTVSDVRHFVRSSIKKILPDNAQDEIIEDILSKASGSFLWVKLALNRIRDNWYTKEDIKAAINEIPKGMEPLYEGMIKTIASQPSKPREIATRILTWVACSFRPLDIAELETALEPEFKGFVNLEHTVAEICGHFAVVSKSKVTLIHHTARQFLLRKTMGLPIRIDEQEGHEHLALVCIDFLSDPPKWRRLFSTLQTFQQSNSSLAGSAVFAEYPFLFYSLSFWAYHVSLASVDCDDLLERVLSFLESNCLLWISGVALSKNLRILTQAAQHLKTYVKRRAHTVSKRPPKSLALARDGELRQWANDLIRVVGRFGNNVAENPSSIHKHVVPFCPKDSIISRSFSHVGHSTFSVTGMSSNNWSDCLAKLTMGEDQTAIQLLCKDTFFITLVGIDGTLIIWHAETCEEARRITHGEYVTHMASSKTSNLVATAGFKTTRIWDITTGEQLHCLPKERHHHTRAIAFGAKDDEILIAYDDCSVQCIDLTTAQEKWRFLAKESGANDHNCARYMSFSPDLTQIAIVFRGRPVVVWTIQPSASSSRYDYIPPKRCILTEDKMRTAAEGDAWDPPEVAIWQPVTDHLLILYEDTRVVDWNVADDEQMQYGHIGARAMVLSPDGNLLLTSDVHGTLSVWTVPEYRLSYQLKYDELVTDLAFSPDATRFYDIRGTFCNVWEPDALIRPTDLDREDMSGYDSSTYETITTDPVLSSDDNTRVPITALVSDSTDEFYCCGKEDGTVVMYDIPKGQKVRKVITHSPSVSIIRLAWSTSGKYLASADDSGRVIAKRLESPTAGKDRWAVFPVFDMRVDNDEAVEHFLFSPRDQYLLIATPTYACVMSLKSKKELCRHPFQKNGVWINHPTDPTLLIRLDAGQEREYLWKTLTRKDESLGSSLDAFTFEQPSDIISRTVQVRGHLVLEMLARTRHNSISQNRHISLLDLSKVSDHSIYTSTSKGEPHNRHRIDGLAKYVRRLIGCFQDRVVFLDHQFWLCTWEMEPLYSKHKRHFFLPKDWLSPTALRLMVLNAQGTLLCPRNGEVAVVRSGLKH